MNNIPFDPNFLRPKATPFTVNLCTLNFVVAILGYSIVMALLSPLGISADISAGENRFFTWPFRAFAAGLGALTLLQVRNRPTPKLDWRMVVFIIFWILYLARAAWDLHVRDLRDLLSVAGYVGANYKLRTWNFIIFGALVPILGIVKSIDIIDFRKAANWIWFVGGCSLFVALRSVQMVADAAWSDEAPGRANASAMLNTIAFGHLGVSVAIVAGYKLVSRHHANLLQRVFSIVIILVGMFVMVRAGSRGPLLCTFAVCFFYALSRSRYVGLGVILAGIFAGAVFAFMNQILAVIKIFSPTLAGRVLATVEAGDTSGRFEAWQRAWDEACDNPLTGGHLDILGYAHNACLDGFMMFGLFAGWIILVLVLIDYFAAYRVLRMHVHDWWVALLAIQGVTAIQTSGCMGGNGFMQCTFLVCLIWTSRDYIRRRAHEERMRAMFVQQVMLARNGVPIAPPPPLPPGQISSGQISQPQPFPPQPFPPQPIPPSNAGNR